MKWGSFRFFIAPISASNDSAFGGKDWGMYDVCWNRSIFSPSCLILQHSVFKACLPPARAEVLYGARALPKADARVLPDYARHAAPLAKAHPVFFGKAAVVARGKLAREMDVAPGMLPVAFAHRFLSKRKEYAYPLADYFADARRLCHGGNSHRELIKSA